MVESVSDRLWFQSLLAGLYEGGTLSKDTEVTEGAWEQAEACMKYEQKKWFLWLYWSLVLTWQRDWWRRGARCGVFGSGHTEVSRNSLSLLLPLGIGDHPVSNIFSTFCLSWDHLNFRSPHCAVNIGTHPVFPAQEVRVSWPEIGWVQEQKTAQGDNV